MLGGEDFSKTGGEVCADDVEIPEADGFEIDKDCETVSGFALDQGFDPEFEIIAFVGPYSQKTINGSGTSLTF